MFPDDPAMEEGEEEEEEGDVAGQEGEGQGQGPNVPEEVALSSNSAPSISPSQPRPPNADFDSVTDLSEFTTSNVYVRACRCVFRLHVLIVGMPLPCTAAAVVHG